MKLNTNSFYFIHAHKCEVLTSALVEYVEEGSIWHVVGNDDGVRGWRCLTGTENRQNVWMRKDPMETQQEERLVVCKCHFTMLTKNDEGEKSERLCILRTGRTFLDDKE